MRRPAAAACSGSRCRPSSCATHNPVKRISLAASANRHRHAQRASCAKALTAQIRAARRRSLAARLRRRDRARRSRCRADRRRHRRPSGTARMARRRGALHRAVDARRAEQTAGAESAGLLGLSGETGAPGFARRTPARQARHDACGRRHSQPRRVRAISHAAAARHAQTSASLRGGCKILLAEDNPINALLTRELLRRRGHRVSEVASGEAAVAAMTRRAFRSRAHRHPHARAWTASKRPDESAPRKG